MSIGRLSIALAGLMWLLSVESLQAQMFGSRPAGSILSSNPLGTPDASGPTGGVGSVKFNERFIRGNRRPGEFVGKGDMRERKGFVGTQQGGQSGRARPAVTGRIQVAPDANRGAPGAGHSGPSEPRLAVGFDVTLPTAERLAASLARQLQASPGFQATGRIEVSVADGIATLRGEVASARDRTLAEQLALFEPGIDSVRNELKVKPQPQSLAPYLPGANSPKNPPPAEK
jgi:hypothetical protein